MLKSKTRDLLLNICLKEQKRAKDKAQKAKSKRAVNLWSQKLSIVFQKERKAPFALSCYSCSSPSLVKSDQKNCSIALYKKSNSKGLNLLLYKKEQQQATCSMVLYKMSNSKRITPSLFTKRANRVINSFKKAKERNALF